MKAGLKNWGECPKKNKARRETIFKAYREWSGNPCLSEGLQYWSMCGESATKDGSLIPGCEFDQACREGFIKPEQWFGVEHRKDIAQLNSALNGSVGGHWMHGDICYSMVGYIGHRPGLVNLDTEYMIENAMELAGKTMMALDLVKHPVFLIVNGARGIRFYGRPETSPEEFLKQISTPIICRLLSEKWRLLGDEEGFYYYRYNGTGRRSSTTMNTIIFYKE